MLSRSLLLVACTLCVCLRIAGQEASSGISIPITVSGEMRYTRVSGSEPDEAGFFQPGFRAVASPGMSLGAHWFLYSALEAYSSSYFPYETGVPQNQAVQLHLMQAFIGYTRSVSKATVLITGGQLSSAFGLFPVEYDDAKMSLIDPPFPYTVNLPIRPDQLPCGVSDVLGQTYGSEIEYHCGGSEIERYGLTPVSLFGLPSLEAQLSLARLDARLQLTNSSPANPQGLGSNDQSIQWTAGGGYSFPKGLHVGISAFKGPYLDRTLAPLLPVGTTLPSFSASGLGLDARWSRGPWSAEGEWMHFRFALPRFIESPSETAAYAQMKRILSPRVFLGMRAGVQGSGRIQDDSGVSASRSAGPQQIYELTFGYRLNRQQLLKAGARWTNHNAWAAAGWFWPSDESSALELELVTSFTAVSKAFR